MAQCSVTGKVFPVEDLVEFKGQILSAEGKAIYLGAVMSGENLPGEMRAAGVIRRFAALALDAFFIGVVVLCVEILVDYRSAFRNLGAFVFFAGSYLYLTLCTAWNGQTLGKLTLKMRVVQSNGLRVSFVKAAGRSALLLAGNILMSITLFGYAFRYAEQSIALVALGWWIINIALALIDFKWHRALHDRLMGTRVILDD